MGMTITEKIIAAHSGRDTVAPGDFVMADCDLASFHDFSAKLVIETFEKTGAPRLFDPERVAMTMARNHPAKDVFTATVQGQMRAFADKYGVKHFFDGAEAGIEHALYPEVGLVWPGMLVLNSDSHTPTMGAFGTFAPAMGWSDVGVGLALGKAWYRVPESMLFNVSGRLRRYVTAKDLVLHVISTIGIDGASYRAMEYRGEAIDAMEMEARMTVCNMAVEAGGKSAVMAADDETLRYLSTRYDGPVTMYQSDSDAKYQQTFEIDASTLPAVVAKPYSPGEVEAAGNVKGVKLTEVYIGSCTNGRISDLRQAAEVLKGRKIAKGVRTFVVPASPQAYREMVREGLIDIFLDAGATVSGVTCGACPGLSVGVLGPDDVCLSTSNRNFPGRMGHPDALVYLGSPYVAAASAVAGTIVDPSEVLN